MSTATVIPIRAKAITVVPHPQVFTTEMVEKIQAVNSTVRFLRMHRHSVISIDLRGRRPTLRVDMAAASLLVTVGHGKSTLRRLGEAPVHSVLIADCKVEWIGPEARY